MYLKFSFWTLASLQIPFIYLVHAQASDIMSQDWGSDIYQWSEPSEVSNVQGQNDLIQPSLFESALPNSGTTVPEDPDLFDWTDLDAPTSDFDNLAADTDPIAIGCTSDSSQSRISKRKKKPKNICPADSSSSSSSLSGVKAPECRLESEICPFGKKAMCCDGEKYGWLKWYGFAVGNCIPCRLHVFSSLQSSIHQSTSISSSLSSNILPSPRCWRWQLHAFGLSELCNALLLWFLGHGFNGMYMFSPIPPFEWVRGEGCLDCLEILIYLRRLHRTQLQATTAAFLILID